MGGVNGRGEVWSSVRSGVELSVSFVRSGIGKNELSKEARQPRPALPRNEIEVNSLDHLRPDRARQQTHFSLIFPKILLPTHAEGGWVEPVLGGLPWDLAYQLVCWRVTSIQLVM